MQIQTVIDDKLLAKASLVTGVADARLLLEHALRLLIQTKTDNEKKTQAQEDAACGFAAGLLRFRKTADIDHFIDIDDFASGLRDKSPGRNVVV
jgi:Arc/MetJ family transcription regulator